MKRIFISLFLLIFIVFTAFFFFGSSRNLSGADYNKITRFDQKGVLILPDTLKVMTYNLGYLSGMTNNRPMDRDYSLFEDNLEEAVQLIREEKPHIIGFQEIDFSSDRSFEQNQADSIALKADFSQAYKSINWDKRYVPFPFWPVQNQFGKVISGQAILSVFPITNEETIRLIQPVNASFVYRSFYLDRLIQVCDIQVGEQLIRVMNLHLEAFDEETREEQAVVVKELFEKFSDKMPVLMIGDFNSRSIHEQEINGAMKVIMQARNIAASVDDSSYLADRRQYYTFDSQAPFQMIDYILYNPNFISKVETEVLQKAGEISDHLPLTMKFVLRPEIE